METKILNFATKIIKQGNSACIRIPKNILDYLNKGIGDFVEIGISDIQTPDLPEEILEIYKRHMPLLKHFTSDQIKEFFRINEIQNLQLMDQPKEDLERLNKMFESSVLALQGNSFYKKYMNFKKAMNSQEDMKKVFDDLFKTKYKESIGEGLKINNINI